MESKLISPPIEAFKGDLLEIANWLLVGSIFVAVFSFFILSGAWVYRYLLSSPIFPLKEITISGSPHLSLEEAMRLAKLRRGKNLLAIDLEEICRSLQGHPWVSEVSIKRDMPDTLHILIRERKPVAVVEMGNDCYFLDKKGVLFLRIRKKEIKGLPILTGLKKEDVDTDDPAIHRLMWDAMILGPLLKERGLWDFNRFRISRATGLTLISQDRGISATIGTKDFGARLDRLKTILTLSSDPWFARLISIDLRYADRAIMKLRSGKESKTQWGKG